MLWWLDEDDRDLLSGQKSSFESLLHLDRDRPRNSRAPRHFVGSVQHFSSTVHPVVDATPATIPPALITWDLITVYQREQVAPGAPLTPTETHLVETHWTPDGLPTACSTLPGEPLADSLLLSGHRRLGLALHAVPTTRGGRAGDEGDYEVSATAEVPSPSSPNAGEPDGVWALVQPYCQAGECSDSDEDELSSPAAVDDKEGAGDAEEEEKWEWDEDDSDDDDFEWDRS